MTLSARNVHGALLARPLQVITVTVLVTLAALTALVDLHTLTPRLDVDPSMTSLLPRSGPDIEVFTRTQELFARDDLLLVAWLGDDLFTPGRLAALKQLTRTIEALPGVHAVDSLANAQDVQISADETRVDEFLRHVPTTVAAATALAERARNNPLVRGRLVAGDGRGLLLAVRFEPDLSTAVQLALVRQIDAASAEHAGPAENFLTGPVRVRLEISRILLRDLFRVMPVAVLATLLVALLGFRSLRGTVVPMVGNLAAVAVTLALFVYAGHGLNFVTVILPPVVYVVGFAYAIHVVTEFDRQYALTDNKRAALLAALEEVQVPLLLTALTTALAFAALGISSIDSIRLFGLFTALGVILACAGALTVIPAGLMLLPGAPPQRNSRRARIAPRLAALAARRRTLILGVGAAFALLSAAAANRISVDTEVLSNFSPASQVQQQFSRIAEIFSGPVPLHILVGSGAPNGLKDPASLAAVAALAEWLQQQPEIGGVYALTDYLTLLQHAVAPDSATALPTSARGVNHLLLIAGNKDERLFVDRAFQHTLLHVRANTLSTAAVNRLAQRIEARLQELPDTLTAQLTGTSYLTARSVDAITRGQVHSLALAFLVVFVVLSVVFGSIRAGAIALLPNALPIVGYFGLLGASGITLNLTTSLVACAVFGIAIDDSVHFISRFALEARRHSAPRERMEAALGAILRPVTLTTLALAAGFIALTVGELRSQAEFGVLAALTLLLAWLVDITFTPALLSRLEVRPVWQRRTGQDRSRGAR